MNSSLTILTTGSNATGISALLSIEKSYQKHQNLHQNIQNSTKNPTEEPTILSRCLINVGDSSQRFCGENKIKLSRVRCVVITSLAPHNVSGLPGILLCLSSLVCLLVLYNHTALKLMMDKCGVLVFVGNKTCGVVGGRGRGGGNKS